MGAQSLCDAMAVQTVTLLAMQVYIDGSCAGLLSTVVW